MIYNMRNFNPRAPRGARRTPRRYEKGAHYISIHAPREGRDMHDLKPCPFCGGISIHAPREGRDFIYSMEQNRQRNFNPRAPRGARRILRLLLVLFLYFNPRAPRGARLTLRGKLKRSFDFNPRAPRGARLAVVEYCFSSPNISIHAPREGRDIGNYFKAV